MDINDERDYLEESWQRAEYRSEMESEAEAAFREHMMPHCQCGLPLTVFRVIDGFACGECVKRVSEFGHDSIEMNDPDFVIVAADVMSLRSYLSYKHPSQDEPTMTYEEMDRINEMEMWGPAGRPQMPRGGW